MAARVGLESWSNSLVRSSRTSISNKVEQTDENNSKHSIELVRSSRISEDPEAEEKGAEENENLPILKKSKQQAGIAAKLYVACFVFIIFIGAALISCVAPFFPNRAMQKGVSQTMVGFIMGVTAVVGCISSWVLALFMFKIGIKFLLCSGMFLAGGCAIIFGVIDFCPPGDSFTVLSFIVRVLEGFGIAMYFNSAFTMAGILFADNFAFVMGLLETATSLGTLLGPSIGGSLYAAGGYFMPFAVLGGALWLLNPFTIYMIPSNLGDSANTNADEHNPLRVLRRMTAGGGDVFITVYAMLSATVSWVFTETTLGVRLAVFGVTNPLLVGAIYLASSGAYSVAAPISGRLADKFNNAWLIIFFGTINLVIGYLIIGPSPILLSQIIPEGLPQLIVGCLWTHTGLAAVVIPTTKVFQKQAEANGLDPNSIGTLAFISSIFQSIWFLGGFLGAVISSALMEHLGYGWATTIQAGIVFSSLLLQIYSIIREKCIKRSGSSYAPL